MTRLVLPLPPSINHSHRQVINGHRVMRIPTRITKDFMEQSGWLAKKWMKESGWSFAVDKKVILRYWVYFPDRRRRDAGNVEKVMTDSLIGVLFSDDRYVLPRAMDYTVDKGNPRVEIELELLEV